MTSSFKRIAFFVSSHGFGHAARASVVISSLHEKLPSLQVDIYTATPAWFFESSLTGLWSHHELMTDVGLVQSSPVVEDLDATLLRLNAFLPFNGNS